jgi:hypothetical protein
VVGSSLKKAALSRSQNKLKREIIQNRRMEKVRKKRKEKPLMNISR